MLTQRIIFTPSLRRVGITTAIETIRNKRCLLFWLIKRIWSSVGNHKWLHQQLLLDFFRVFFIVFPFLTGRRCLRKSYPTGRKKKEVRSYYHNTFRSVKFFKVTLEWAGIFGENALYLFKILWSKNTEKLNKAACLKRRIFGRPFVSNFNSSRRYLSANIWTRNVKWGQTKGLTWKVGHVLQDRQ